MVANNNSMSPANIHLRLMHFSELDTAMLYSILQLRCSVFVVEQACVYQDLDNLDQHAQHLLVHSSAVNSTSAEENTLVAYARLLPPGLIWPEAAIGRVLTATDWRGCGHGRWLIQQAAECCRQLYPDSGIKISAQQHLKKLYTSCNFIAEGRPYDEDGIPHISMRYTPVTT